MNRIIFLIILVCLPGFLFSQEPDNRVIQRPSVGLVLSGGGAKGFSYVGLLKVLEEVDMPIDYIGGSSIGAIVGALYAAGYSPETIEELIRKQDWDALVTDKLERTYISYEEKIFSDKYVFSIPIEEKGISLSNALMGSFNIDLMLNDLFSPVAHIKDFKDLPIPFLCIGTDLLTGEAVILDSGNIARAVRASMAIPGYFPPIEYAGKLLIDGGVVNNYPAEQIKELGLDIIIGGDVQSGLKTSVDELNDVTAIMDQVISFNRIDANEKGWALTDEYVHIPMNYGMLDFTEYDSIIAIGEKVARENYSELKALADSINALRDFERKPTLGSSTDSLKIDKINLRGMNWQQRERFIGYFEGIERGKSSINEIEERMKLLKGTRSFNGLYYELVSEEKNIAHLDIFASAPNKGSLAAGIHSDNVYLGSILVNVALRNIRETRAKFFTDLVIGPNPRLNSMYIVNNGFKPGLGLETDFYRFSFPLYHKDEKINTWTFETINASVFTPMTVRNNFFFQAGLKYEIIRFTQDVAVDSILSNVETWNDYGNLFIALNYDNRDRVDFPTEGRTVKFHFSHVVPFDGGWDDFASQPTCMSLSYKTNMSLKENLVYSPGFFIGYTLFNADEDISLYNGSFDDSKFPVQHLFGFGGLNPNNYVKNHIPFSGLRFIERMGTYAGKVSMSLQYNFYPRLYATLLSDVGFNEFDVNNINLANLLVGGGIKFSYDSFIGPVEVSFMQSNMRALPTIFLNVGYWF